MKRTTLRALALVAIALPAVAACSALLGVDDVFYEGDAASDAAPGVDSNGGEVDASVDATLDAKVDASAAVDADANGAMDADADAAVVCDPGSQTFGTPQRLLEFDTIYNASLRLTADELTAFVPRDFNPRIMEYSRLATTAPFDAPKVVDTGDAGYDIVPSVTGDGLRLYFIRYLEFPTPDGSTTSIPEIYTARRTSRTDPFGAPARVPGTQQQDDYVYVLPGNQALYLGTHSGPMAHADLDGGAMVGRYTLLFPFNTGGDFFAVAAESELAIYFSRPVAPGGQRQINVATRPSKVAQWHVRVASELLEPDAGDAGLNHRPDWISPDGCRLYFARLAGGFATFWMASLLPNDAGLPMDSSAD